jgi:hypothetical protein
MDTLGIVTDDLYHAEEMYYTDLANKNNAEAQKFNELLTLYNVSEEARKYYNSLIQQGYENEEAARLAGLSEYWNQMTWNSTSTNDSNSGNGSSSNGGNGDNGGNNGNNGGLNDDPPPAETPKFTGSTYKDAQNFAKENGLDASSIMNPTAWAGLRLVNRNHPAVSNYDSYEEYLADVMAYLIETKG